MWNFVSIVFVFFVTRKIASANVDDDLVQIEPTRILSMFDGTLRPLTALASPTTQKGQSRAGVPQSLTLLMNFKTDGTTSFQIMQGTQIVYLDNGFCKYGQLFDPSTGRCRDIYCQELNYRFNGTMCVPDESKNVTDAYKPLSDIDLLIPLVIHPRSHHERGEFSSYLNSQMNESCLADWNEMFFKTLRSYLKIDGDRIKKISHCPRENDERMTSSALVARKAASKGGKISAAAALPLCTAPANAIPSKLAQNESIPVNLYFSLADRNERSNDNLTGSHVLTLLLLASEYPAVLDICQSYTMKVGKLSIVSDPNRTREEFCQDPDHLYQAKFGVLRRRIRADGQSDSVIDYVVDVPELNTTYEMGDFIYMFIISSPTQQEPQPSVNSTLATMVSVCNRHPRIVERCPEGLVMRVALCEVTQYRNYSIRIKRTSKLYTNREYRYDEFRPDLYVVICKHEMNNATAQGKMAGFVEKAPGILSTIASILSIFALVISLITFALFSSLRNLPGCNIINLIIALIIAQILFLCQSLMIMTRSSVCLIFALGIHFFYLASFFWMNVMAFDLWRTFHKGFSLYLYDIRERLPWYMCYAWGMPVIIVLIGIGLDAANAKMKPCYGRFFRGCYDVCFRTKNDAPLQGCWIESAMMRFILFGCPVAVILIVNFVLYALTVRSIRRALKKVRVQVERKFQRKKQVVPGEHDVKIYMRMASLAGFGWTIGFILFVLPDGQQGFQRYLAATFKYLFILLNATPGLFIFAVYVCNRRVFALYRQLFGRIFRFFCAQTRSFGEFLGQCRHLSIARAKHRFAKVHRFLHGDRKDELSLEAFSTFSPTEKSPYPMLWMDPVFHEQENQSSSPE